MKPSRRTTVIAASCLVVCLAGSILALRQVDRLRPQATLDDVLYFSSPKTVKRASLGYDGLMACIYWTRAVQYFGGRTNTQSLGKLAPLLEITTTLDPHLIVAYQFGASFLAPPPPWGAGQPARAVQLLEYGIQNNPNDWHLYYNLGFVYYMNVKDYAKAADAFDRGSKVPNAHPFLSVLAAQMAQHAGDIQMARALWLTTYQSTRDKQIRGSAVAHLRALKVDEDVARIQDAVTAYGQRTGNLPPSMATLINAGLLPGRLVDPDGHSYQLMSEGRVEVQYPDDFPFITKGMPPGYKPGPLKNLEKLTLK